MRCSKCHKGFSCTVTHLDEAVDVHYKWLEALEEKANEEIEEEKEKAKEKEKERATRMEKSVLKQKEANTEVSNPISKKRKAENDAPESDSKTVKRSKPTDYFAEQSTNLTKIVSTAPVTVKLHHTSSANEQARQRRDLQAAIELNRTGKILATQADARKKAVLAKDRREAKAREWARLEQEELCEWRAVVADAIAAAIVTRIHRLTALPPDSPPEQKAVAKVSKTEETTTAQVPSFGDDETKITQLPKNEIIQVENMTIEEASDIYDKLFGSSSKSESDSGSANSIFDIPTPEGSPESSPDPSDHSAVPTIKTEFVGTCETTERDRRTSYDSLFGGSSSEKGKDEMVDVRRDSLDSLFGSSE